MSLSRAALGTVALTLALTFASCAKRTEIVIGVATDLRLPDEIDEVELFVRDDIGSLLATGAWDVDPSVGFDVLPGSIGLLPRNDPAQQILVVVQGSKKMGLNPDGTSKIEPRIARKARLSFVEGRTLFLRMVLLDPCYSADGSKAKDTFCNDMDKWCNGGVCQSITVDGNGLPEYHSGLEKQAECGDDWKKLGLLPPDRVACPDGQVCVDAVCIKPSGPLPDLAMIGPLEDASGDFATVDAASRDQSVLVADLSLPAEMSVPADLAVPVDMSIAPPDRSMSLDLTTPLDLSSDGSRPPDFGAPLDLTAMMDATLPDLVTPPDFTMPPDFTVPDSATPADGVVPLDLTIDDSFVLPMDLTMTDTFVQMGDVGSTRPQGSTGP